LFFVLPNPPIKNGWIDEERSKNILGDSNQLTRLTVRYLFEEIMITEMKKIDVEIIDIYKNFLGSDFFVDEKYLIEGDHHFKSPNNFLSLFKKYFS
jgi:hypothetical protein